MNVIYLSRNGIRAILLFAATHDIRYYLNGIKVEATSDATRVIGTNGHVLGAHHSKQTNTVSGPIELIVPRSIVAMIRKAKGVLPVQLEGEGTAWSLRDYALDYTVGFKPIEGKFPDYTRVVPKELSGQPSNFQPAYHTILGQAAETLGHPATRLVISHNEPKGALVTIGGNTEFCGVLMPYRPDEQKRPEWMDVSLIAPVAKGSAEGATTASKQPVIDGAGA